MGMIDATKSCFRKYIRFSGRATRSEFWYFVLFYFLCYVILLIINSALFGPTISTDRSFVINGDGTRSIVEHTNYQYNAGWFGTIFSLSTILPMFSAGWRRLHDIGRRGWWLLMPPVTLLSIVAVMISSALGWSEIVEAIRTTGQIRLVNASGSGLALFVILASFIALIFMLSRPSQPDPNKYGPNPNEVTP
jgi:uncharacterized membrane protein YhaH (DUF805 family)